MLTVSDMQAIYGELVLGKPRTVTGAEADQFRRDLARDVAYAKEHGIGIDMPTEWEVDTGGPDGDKGFCPTGQGGGTDNSCGNGGGGGRSNEIVDAEVVDKPGNKPSNKPAGDGGKVDAAVAKLHSGRPMVPAKEAIKAIADTGLKLKAAKGGGVDAPGHTHEEVIDGMRKNGWTHAKSVPDPDNPDFMFTILEKGGRIASIHGQSEAARKRLGRGDASKILPPHIEMSDNAPK